MRLSRKATLVFNRNWYSIALYWNHCKTYEYTIQADLHKTIPMICFPKWKYQCENQVLVLFSTFVYRLPKEISTNSTRFESSLFRKFRRKTPVPHLFLINLKKKRLQHNWFSLKTCKIFCRTHLVAASAGSEYFFPLLCNASKNAMQACFKSYRNQTRDIPLVSVWRENETFIAFFEECGAKKNTDHVFFFDLPKLDTNGLHWISHRKSNHSSKEAVAQRCSVNGVLTNS